LARTSRFIISPCVTSRSAAVPIDCSVARIASTMARSSSGSSETRWSLPSIARSTVKCFSITLAPSAMAATGTNQPRSWPE
jgi:hypothetical protein